MRTVITALFMTVTLNASAGQTCSWVGNSWVCRDTITTPTIRQTCSWVGNFWVCR